MAADEQISRARVTKIGFLPYLPYNERSAYIRQDYLTQLATQLQYLLRLPFYGFWSQVLFDQSFHRLLDTFFAYAPWQKANDILPDVWKEEKALQQCMFIVCLRMGSPFEDNQHCLDHKVFGEMIYNHQIWNIPRLMDFCLLYGRGNNHLTSRIVSQVLSSHPNYNTDLEAALPTFSDILSNIQTVIAEAAGEYGPRLALKDNMALLIDLRDAMTTLYALTRNYPPVATIVAHYNVHLLLATVYESVIPRLYMAASADHLLHEWSRTNDIMIKAAAVLLEEGFIKPCESTSDNASLASELADVLQEWAKCPLFARQFMRYDGHLERILQLASIGSLGDCVQNFMDAAERAELRKTEDITNGVGNLTVADISISKADDEVPAEHADQIALIQDMIPDVSAGFLLECLRYYRGNVEELLDALISNILPTSLEVLPRDMPISTSDKGKGVSQSTAIISQSDQLKVLTDKGPQNEYNEKDWSKERSDPEAKEITRWLAKSYEFQQDDEYNDEYDDTYDDVDIGPVGDESADELLKNQKFGHNRWTDTANAADYDLDSAEAGAPNKNSTLTTVNKGQIRGEPSNRARGRGRGRGRGKATEQELRDRSFKDRHKAQRANHNRKDRASNKLAKGMN